LVYYISNLILLYKYTEASKAIEHFGLKLHDPLCKANMIKLEGIINYINCKDKEAYKKFDEANRLFKELDNVYG